MIRSINHSRKEYVLQVTGISWKKNHESLFDYDDRSNDSHLVFKEGLSMKETYFLIFRNKKTLELQIQTKSQLTRINQKDLQKMKQLICAGRTIIKDRLLQIKFYQPDEIIAQNQEQGSSQYKSYSEHHLVVRSLLNSEKQPIGYKLKINNILKLGSCEFFIHSINSKQQSEQMEDYTENIITASQNVCEESSPFDHIRFFIQNNQRVYDASKEKNDPLAECKYCMMPQSHEKGQFLCSPCKCMGSCGLVHFNCLVKWNQNKVKKTQNKGCVEYNFQKFFCEVCRQQYPQYIRKGNKNYELLPVEKPKQDFIIIEALNSLKRHIIIIQNIKNESLTIGRGNQCELKLEDATISRKHAFIKKVGVDFVIFDLKSKFGTLVRDINPILPLKLNDKFSIQAGKSVISFSLLKKSSEFLFQQ